MQKLFTTILFLFGIPAIGLAQITLDFDNVPMDENYVDARFSVFSDPPITAPVEGEDQVYDFAELFSSLIDTTRYHAATDPNFESSTRFYVGTPGLGPIGLESEYYEGIDETGIFRTGSYLRPQKESLVTFTGNPEDSIVFPGTYSIFDDPDYILKFPATYGDEWSSEAKFITETEVTASAFFLDAAPVVNEQSFTRDASVVGWGELTLPGANDDEVTFDVLMVRNELIWIDSFFLGDDPAPPQLLSAFNLTQGAVISSQQYNFYAADFNTPLLTVYMDGDWETATFATFKSGLVVSNTDELTRVEVQGNVFPNPASAGQNLVFQLEESLENPVLSVMDNTGRLVFQGEPNRTSEREFSWSSNGELSQGIYFYSLEDRETNRASSGKLIIH